MANLSTKIYNVANRLLKDGEEIRAVGQFSSGWHPLVGITLAALGGALACFTFGISLVLSLIGMLILASATKFWYVSVTNQRVIFTQLSFWGTPDVNRTYSIPLHHVRLLDNGLSVQPVSPDFPQNFRFYFGAKSITGLDKGNFMSALAYQASGSQTLDETIKYPTPAQPSDCVVAIEQQEEAKQRKRRTWGWVFVIGSGLFTLMGICQIVAAIAYSVSSSAAEAVQKSGIIAIVAPLGCNAIWLVLWSILLGLSIKNLRSVLQTTKPTQFAPDTELRESKTEHMPPGTTSTASTPYSRPGQDTSNDNENALLNAAEYGEIDVEKMKARRDVKGLIKALRYQKDKYVRMAAARALGEIKDARAVEPLIAALGDEEWVVREPVAKALGEIGDARAVEALGAALWDDNGLVGTSAAEALGKIGGARAVDLLGDVLKDSKNSFFRKDAAKLLGKIGGPRAVEILIAALKDKESNVRVAATDALIRIGTPAVEMLCAALQDEDVDVRWHAVKALGEIGDARAEEPISSIALNDKDKDVREAATRALEGIQVRQAKIVTYYLGCLVCGAKMSIKDHGMVGSGSVDCPSCGEIHDYLIEKQTITIGRRAVPIGWSGPAKLRYAKYDMEKSTGE